MFYSSKGEGFFTKAHLGFVFAPFEWLSPRAKEIHDAQKKKVAENRDKYPVWLREQYDIMVERLDKLGPGCELLPFAGFSSFPSAWNLTLSEKRSDRLIILLWQIPHWTGRNTSHTTSL